MSKNTMGTRMPRKLETSLQTVGEQIKLARLRRNLSVAQVSERATCSPLTVSRIEKGTPTVAIGIYLRVLYALQHKDDILPISQIIRTRPRPSSPLPETPRTRLKESISRDEALVIIREVNQAVAQGSPWHAD